MTVNKASDWLIHSLGTVIQEIDLCIWYRFEKLNLFFIFTQNAIFALPETKGIKINFP